MEQERINANVNSLSQKLLEGCKLLSDSCPETNVPLVSTPNGRMFSVGNGSYYVREAGELVAAWRREPCPARRPRRRPRRPSRRPAASSHPVRRRRSGPTVPDGQSLSSRVAAEQLEGFTLSSRPGPSVPLVGDASGRISVGTGRW